MKMFFWVWCFSLAAQVWGGTGTIQMSDGKKLEGEIRPGSHGFTISNTNGQNTAVDLKQVSRLQMHEAEAQDKSKRSPKSMASPPPISTTRISRALRLSGLTPLLISIGRRNRPWK